MWLTRNFTWQISSLLQENRRRDINESVIADNDMDLRFTFSQKCCLCTGKFKTFNAIQKHTERKHTVEGDLALIMWCFWTRRTRLRCPTFISVRGGGGGGLGGLQPFLSGKNSIIRAKLMYHSGKDTVRWDTCCSKRQLTTEGKRPLSYHSLLHMYWQSRQWTSIKVWGQWPGPGPGPSCSKAD